MDADEGEDVGEVAAATAVPVTETVAGDADVATNVAAGAAKPPPRAEAVMRRSRSGALR